MKYFSVLLTKDHSELNDVNYKQIFLLNYDDVDRWSLLPLDLGSRIQTIKMNILPRLLYLFTALPVEVSVKQFRGWDEHFSRFIWSNKRRRVRYSTLPLPGERGGMALPCLQGYYLSAQLRPLVCRCNPAYEAEWKDTELSLMDIPMQSVLGCLDRLTEACQSQNPCVSLSLKMWSEAVWRFQLHREMGLLSWPAFHPRFLLPLQDHKYRQWAKQGITSFCRIIKNGDLINFDDLMIRLMSWVK